jgi:hypothetical protein
MNMVSEWINKPGGHMKKLVTISLVVFCAVVLTSLPVRAADEMKEDGMGMDKGDHGPMGMMGDKENMKGMRGMMMHASMVATPDGGVIVLSGRTLTKYDKDLNVVKEVELSAPQPGMGMMDKDSGGGMGMMDKDKDKAQPADKGEAPAGADENAVHP